MDYLPLALQNKCIAQLMSTTILQKYHHSTAFHQGNIKQKKVYTFTLFDKGHLRKQHYNQLDINVFELVTLSV